MAEEVYIDRVSRTLISVLSKEVARELIPLLSAEIKAAVRQEIGPQKLMNDTCNQYCINGTHPV